MWIQTRSGRAVSLLEPQCDTICFGDIAWSLAHICRFTGHVRQHYSVAEHCVRVAKLLPVNIRIHGLLHDAPEAYTGDIATPIKWMLGDDGRAQLKTMTAGLLDAIYDAADIPPPSSYVHGAVKYADVVLMMTERRDLLGTSPKSWGDFESIEPLSDKILPWTPFEAEVQYLQALRACGVGAGVADMVTTI